MSSVRSAFSSSLPSIRAAVARSKNEALRRHFQNSHLVAGIHCTGLTVKQLNRLRGLLPDFAKLVIAKNSYVEKATEGTPWESLKYCAKGMNAWLFVRDDDRIPAALKPYRDFQKEWKLALNDFTGAVFEGRVYGPDEFEALETMPTREESYCYFLGCLQSPAASLIGTLEMKDRDLGEGVDAGGATAQ